MPPARLKRATFGLVTSAIFRWRRDTPSSLRLEIGSVTSMQNSARRAIIVCTENLNPEIVMVKTAEDRV
jgi:hypothetical protein